MSDEEFNERLRKHFDEMNSVGLGELLLFGKDINRFVENETRRSRLLNRIVKLCGYQTSARDFAKMVSYEDFKKQPGMSEITALGLKLYLFYACGVDWENPDNIVKGFGEG